ncbi:F-actin-uncapping protein LRRC16A isoform X2 [Aphidius gifuensis]|uniref:F-actin-uncapping protein LRRC16A isoform X2 n=1 Tax=Aphidius gifuensis TaxID=684658 RepID=UPI001CDB8012|nr:F-actin-uncapping protein LRRC16A isoform X2 [Aphidius gifuensis]
MSTCSQLTKELNESVKALLGKNVKILLKNVVKLETKPEKLENRVLVFSPCRLFLLTAKVPTRIDCHFHYLEITSVESKRPNQLCLTASERSYNFTTTGTSGVSLLDTSEIDAMIEALHTAIRNIFPTVPLNYVIRKIDVIPPTRLQNIRSSELARSTEATRTTGPCGGFSTQYACMCDLHGVQYREEVSLDVDTIYQSQNTYELNLRDFDHLEQKDLVPIISALEYNTWFKKLRLSNMKLNNECLDRLLHIIKRSLSLEELYFDNIGIKSDFAHKLSLAAISNPNSVLNTIDLSYNLIEDKGATSLCGLIAKLTTGCNINGTTIIGYIPQGLKKLSLTHCSLTSKGISQLSHAFNLNRTITTSLNYLNISDNNIKDDINNLCNYLRQPNTLTYLDIGGVDATLELIFNALQNGCITNLIHLNVSRNIFITKKTKEIPPSFKQFFTSTYTLKYLNISYCKLPLEGLKNLLLGLACNENTNELELDMSGNNLGSMGAHILESCIHGVRCLSSLDISDSNMDVDIGQVITAIGKNKSIKHLYMSKNLLGMKSKNITIIMDSLVQMLQEDDCVLESLYIQDSRLKSDIFNLIDSLGNNKCLKIIDISGNLIGDSGARILAKTLQINTTIKKIIYDKNNITIQGYSDIIYALENNYNIKYMPFPIYDIQQCMKISSERTEQLFKKLQDILQRNISEIKYYNNCNNNIFKLKNGLLLNTTQNNVDRLVIQTQDTIKTLAAETCDLNNDINYATSLIQDADNSKQLSTKLHDLIIQRNMENNLIINNKLNDITFDIHKLLCNCIDDTFELLLKTTNDYCSNIMSQVVMKGGDKSELITVEDDIRNIFKSKNNITIDYINSCIIDKSGTDIIHKINEINLTIAGNIADRINDEIIDLLTRSYKTLIGDYCDRTRSSTPDVLRPSASSISSGSVIGIGTGVHSCHSTTGSIILTNDEHIYAVVSTADSITDNSGTIGGDGDSTTLEDGYPSPCNLMMGSPIINSSNEQSSPTATPHLSSKRKGININRNLRPKSVTDTVEGLSIDDIPNLLPSIPKEHNNTEGISENEHSLTESLDSISELPNTSGQQLQHLVKTRPKRTKTRAPTRPMLQQTIDSLALGEGLDVFFRPTTPTTPLVSPTSDDISLHTFPQIDGSPNLSVTSQPSIQIDNNDNSKKNNNNNCNSPMLKTLLEPTPRSISSDNLEKFSPIAGRRSQGDTPLTASPLVRRNTNENDSGDFKKKIINTNLPSSTNCQDNNDYCTTNSTIDNKICVKVAKANFEINNDVKFVKINKTIPPAIAPKPRPWSMSTDRKSGEFNNLLSDGSSPNTSAGNTPDSGDALEESIDNGMNGPASLPPTLTGTTVGSLNSSTVEKRSVKELAASLNKGNINDRKENEQNVNSSRSLFHRTVEPISNKVPAVLKKDEEGHKIFKLRRTSFLRDSNYNYDNDTVDV